MGRSAEKFKRAIEVKPTASKAMATTQSSSKSYPYSIPSSPVSATSEFDSGSSAGDFDQFDIDGGAELSDITTPPSTPPLNIAGISAPERLFANNVSQRPPAASDRPLSDRLTTDFGAHDYNVSNKFPRQYQEGVSAFVDVSNVSIGLFESLRAKINMPKRQPLPDCFNFNGLRQILERGRTLSKGFAAGSKSVAGKTPHHFQGIQPYHPIILSRILAEPAYENCSDSEKGRTTKPREREQGVDEMLQLRMATVTLRSQPGIMVLVTGDGNSNGTGFSDGFPLYVELALERGWVVEVYSFKKNSAECWTSRNFLEDPRWAGRLSHHSLDEYTQDMCTPRSIPRLADLAAQYRPKGRPAIFTAKPQHPTGNSHQSAVEARLYQAAGNASLPQPPPQGPNTLLDRQVDPTSNYLCQRPGPAAYQHTGWAVPSTPHPANPIGASSGIPAMRSYVTGGSQQLNWTPTPSPQTTTLSTAPNAASAMNTFIASGYQQHIQPYGVHYDYGLGQYIPQAASAL